MSKLTDVAKTTQVLSVTAMEEASRGGARTSDIEHLFLALVVSEQGAGDVLRACGITLHAAREAVAAQHAAQLAVIGVNVPAPEPGPIVSHETGGYEWSERAFRLFSESCATGKRGDAAAVLRELVDEPSGMIRGVLARLGTTPEEVRERLDDAEHAPDRARPRPAGSDLLAGELDAFVPATVDEVWALLSTPERLPEWDANIGRIAPDGAADTSGAGGGWQAWARDRRPDGTRLRVRPDARRLRVELVAIDPPTSIEWSFSFPDMPRANLRRVRVALRPVAGGTRLRIGIRWIRGGRRTPRGIRGVLLRPLYRYLIWMQLTQLSGAVSRVLR